MDSKMAQTSSMIVVRKIHALWCTILDFSLFTSCFSLGDVFWITAVPQTTPHRRMRCMWCMSDQDLEPNKCLPFIANEDLKLLKPEAESRQTHIYYIHLSSIHLSIHPSIIKIIKPNISIYHQIISEVAHANTYTPPRMLNKTLGKLADISLLNLRSSVKSFTFSLGPGPQDVHFPSFLWCTIIYSSSIYQTG